MTDKAAKDPLAASIIQRYAILGDAHLMTNELALACTVQSLEAERAALTARLAAAEADAELWRHFRQLVKNDTVRAQAIVWNADKSRTKFTYAVKQSIAFAKRAASNAAMTQETKNGS